MVEAAAARQREDTEAAIAAGVQAYAIAADELRALYPPACLPAYLVLHSGCDSA